MDIEIILLLGLACAYVTKCLVLERKDSHVGPFKFKSIFVLFPQEENRLSDGLTEVIPAHLQQAALFDAIRYLGGAYYTTDDSGDFQTVWKVHAERSERFTCPFCLSFWTALLFSIPFIAFYQINPILFPVAHFAIASLSTLFVGALNYALRV